MSAYTIHKSLDSNMRLPYFDRAFPECQSMRNVWLVPLNDTDLARPPPARSLSLALFNAVPVISYGKSIRKCKRLEDSGNKYLNSTMSSREALFNM